MDNYYNKRYRHIINVVQTIFTHNIGGIEEQTDMFTDIEFFFDFDYYRLENNTT
jgi:hypothetical protein